MRSELKFLVALGLVPIAGCSLIFDPDDYVAEGIPAGCDADGDGYTKMTPECGGGTDCDDSMATVYPGAPPDCTTEIIENCDHLEMEDFRNGIMGATNPVEAGYLRTTRIENQQLSYPRIAITGIQGGYPGAGGTGYLLWSRGTSPKGEAMITRFDLNDPANYTTESLLTDLGVEGMDEVVDLAACAASTDTIAITAVREHSGQQNLRVQVATLENSFGTLTPTFAAMPDDLPAPVSTTWQAPEAGVTNCFYDVPNSMTANAPYHVVRGNFDNMTPFVARLQSSASPTLSDFAYTTAGSPPTSDAPGQILGTGGRHAFFSNGNRDTLNIWDAATVTDPPSESDATDGSPAYPAGSVSVAFITGAADGNMHYLMAVPQDDATFIHTIDCPSPGMMGDCVVNVMTPTDTVPDMDGGAPTLTAMSTWHNDFGGTGAVLATQLVEGAGGQPMITLHFLTDDGSQFPIYGAGNEDIEHLRNAALEDLPVDLQVTSVNDEDGLTVLIASLQYGDTAGTYDIQIDGFRICERP